MTFPSAVVLPKLQLREIGERYGRADCGTALISVGMQPICGGERRVCWRLHEAQTAMSSRTGCFLGFRFGKVSVSGYTKSGSCGIHRAFCGCIKILQYAQGTQGYWWKYVS